MASSLSVGTFGWAGSADSLSVGTFGWVTADITPQVGIATTICVGGSRVRNVEVSVDDIEVRYLAEYAAAVRELLQLVDIEVFVSTTSIEEVCGKIPEDILIEVSMLQVEEVFGSAVTQERVFVSPTEDDIKLSVEDIAQLSASIVEDVESASRESCR